MNTLLYVSQIVVGGAVLAAGLAAGLAGSTPRRAHVAAPSASVTTYADTQVAGLNGLFAALFALAAIGFGVAGLAGASPTPAPVAFLVTTVALISVLLATDTTPTSYPVAADKVSTTVTESTSTAVPAIPSHARPSQPAAASPHAA
jgi:hypothetical protein